MTSIAQMTDGYCKSAEVYALQHNYNASLYAFDACLLLDPNYPGAERFRRYVLCQLYRLYHLRSIELDAEVIE